MSATLRIHRGLCSADRVLTIGGKKVGSLSEEVNDFEITPGDHVLSLNLGIYHSVPTHVRVADGTVVEFKAVENPDALLPVLQGGFIKLERIPPVRA